MSDTAEEIRNPIPYECRSKSIDFTAAKITPPFAPLHLTVPFCHVGNETRSIATCKPCVRVVVLPMCKTHHAITEPHLVFAHTFLCRCIKLCLREIQGARVVGRWDEHFRIPFAKANSSILGEASDTTSCVPLVIEPVAEVVTERDVRTA